MTLPNEDFGDGLVVCSYYTQETLNDPENWNAYREFELLIVLLPFEPHYAVYRDDLDSGETFCVGQYENLGQALGEYFELGAMLIDAEGTEMASLAE